jgi:hypothetical protein
MTNPEAANADTVARMSDAEFVAAFQGLTIREFDALTARLLSLANRDEQKESINAKYRALTDHRCRQLRELAPHMFY